MESVGEKVKNEINIFLSLLPFACLAESYLCIPDAGAVVEDGGERAVTASLADVSQSKFVLTQGKGKWVLKKIGEDLAFFDSCKNVYFCEASSGYGGAFWRKDDGTFSITWMTQTKDRDLLIVAKGKCSKI